MSVSQQIEAVIFDMDGVLVDSEPLYHQAVNEILLAESSPTLPVAEYARYLGVTTPCMWQDLVERWHLPGEVADYLRRFETVIIDAYRTRASTLPGVWTLLETLKAKGVLLAVASSSPSAWVEACLDSLGIAGYFGAAVGGDMVAQGKPDPAVFVLAAEKLGVAPASCMVIEDSPKGITAGLAAGMTTVVIDTPYTSRELTADAHIQVRSLGDVEDVLDLLSSEA